MLFHLASINFVSISTDHKNINLHYDLELTVFDADGKELANSVQKGKEPIGGAAISQNANAQSASLALSTKISYLFNDPAIKAALK